jgi:hypothetical protein
MRAERVISTSARLLAGLVLLSLVAGLYLGWRRERAGAARRLDSGTALWGDARTLASRVENTESPSAFPSDPSREMRRAEELARDSLELARRIDRWRETRGEDVPSGKELLGAALDVADRICTFEKLLEQLDSLVGPLERARVTALDAIRILMYNLAAGGGAPPDDSSAFDVLTPVRGEIAERWAELDAQLVRAKRAARELASRAESFREQLIEASLDSTAVKILLVLITALALWLAMVLTLSGLLRRDGGGGAAGAVKRIEREKERSL